MEEGEHNNVSKMASSVHVGTHVDAPYHFIADGKTIEQLRLDVLIGPAQVIELPEDCGLVTADDLKKAGIAEGTERLLLKTRNSHYWYQPGLPFQTDFVALSPDGAEYLVQRGVKLIGIDYFSIAPFRDSIPTHRILLGAEVIILEGVNLSRSFCRAVPALLLAGQAGRLGWRPCSRRADQRVKQLFGRLSETARGPFHSTYQTAPLNISSGVRSGYNPRR